MEMKIFSFESAANGLALSTKSDGKDLRVDHVWRKVRELRLNRPKLAELGVRDVEGALSLLSGGKPYYYHAGLTTEPRCAAGSNSSGGEAGLSLEKTNSGDIDYHPAA